VGSEMCIRDRAKRAPVIGARFAGLVSPFPVFGAVMAVFSHRSHGPSAGVAAIEGLLAGLFTPAVFFFVLAVTPPGLGLWSFGVATTAALCAGGDHPRRHCSTAASTGGASSSRSRPMTLQPDPTMPAPLRTAQPKPSRRPGSAGLVLLGGALLGTAARPRANRDAHAQRTTRSDPPRGRHTPRNPESRRNARNDAHPERPPVQARTSRLSEAIVTTPA